VRGVDLAVFFFATKVVRVKAISSVMAAMRTVMAISKAMAFLDVVSGPTAPITHFAVVFAPGVNGTIANSNLSLAFSPALEVGGLVHIVVNAAVNTGDSVGSGKLVRTPVHGQTFSLKGFFESSNAVGNLLGFGMVGMEILNFTLEGGIVFVH